MIDPEDGLTPEKREDALDAVALVRLSLQDRPEGEIQQSVEALLDGRKGDDVVGLLWTVATLAGMLLSGWHHSIVTVTDPDFAHEIPSVESLLDTIVQMVVNAEETP